MQTAYQYSNIVRYIASRLCYMFCIYCTADIFHLKNIYLPSGEKVL